MPVYRQQAGRPGFMHIKLGGRGSKNPPAPCVARAWIEGKDERCACISGFLCDHELSNGQTCDAPLCDAHAHQVAKNRHLCPGHFAAYREREPDLFSAPAET